MATLFEKLGDMLTSIDAQLAAANAVSKAYADHMGTLFEPLTSESPVTAIGANLSPFYTVMAAIEFMAVTGDDDPFSSEAQQSVWGTLEGIAGGILTSANADNSYRAALCIVAHATWQSGQAFRGLERLTRSPMRPWVTLPESEQYKDLMLCQAAAKYILWWLESQGVKHNDAEDAVS